jgi:hypothetical protein
VIHVTCSMSHTSRIPFGDALLADLPGGWHVTYDCPVCQRPSAARIDTDLKDHLDVLGVPTLLECDRLRRMSDEYGRATLGPLTGPQVDLWAATWALSLPTETDALIGAWLKEATDA